MDLCSIISNKIIDDFLLFSVIFMVSFIVCGCFFMRFNQFLPNVGIGTVVMSSSYIYGVIKQYNHSMVMVNHTK